VHGVTSATERHATLIDAGWTCRLDGRWKPPAEWDDTRSYTADAAWEMHLAKIRPSFQDRAR
jgi:hypothetical protein